MPIFYKNIKPKAGGTYIKHKKLTVAQVINELIKLIQFTSALAIFCRPCAQVFSEKLLPRN